MVLPVITVVIPTSQRPQLLLRAARSVLKQTFSNIELIIVIDGQDAETRAAVATLKDKRVRCFELAENQGAPSARNRGISEARGAWIALLDDDDEWYPTKLEKQFLLAKKMAIGHPIVACLLKVQAPGGSYLLPRRLPRESESVGDYLFVRRSLFRGEGTVATSMLFTTKELLQKYPFHVGLKRHQEADWLIRVCANEPVELQFVNEPLGVLHIDSSRPRVSESNDWRYSFEWVKSRRDLLTSEAYTAFLLLAVSSVAAREKDWPAFWLILRESFRSGPTLPLQYGLFLGMWFIPQSLRQFIRIKWLARKE